LRAERPKAATGKIQRFKLRDKPLSSVLSSDSMAKGKANAEAAA
jgi:hypothetical protein